MLNQSEKKLSPESYFVELVDGNELATGLLMSILFLACLATPVLFFPTGWFLISEVLLPFDNLTRRGDRPDEKVLGTTLASVLNVAHWLLAAAIFAFSARRVRVRFAIPLAFTVIILVVCMIHLLSHLCGLVVATELVF